MSTLDEMAKDAGLEWFDYQREALLNAAGMLPPTQRLCLYYKTGAGKSVTALATMKLWGQAAVIVIAPPSTHPEWQEWGRKLGVFVHCMSHAKFRMPSTKMQRDVAVIADEIHLFGGHGGKGWLKLDRLARGLQAPMVLASATPNYNDADRVYCIQHILDPHSCKGGFLEFLYRNCNTKQNPFSMTPDVDEDRPFIHFKNAAEYLAALDGVEYLEDDLVYAIGDIHTPWYPPAELVNYGLNSRRARICASGMERRHAETDLFLIGGDGGLWSRIWMTLQSVRRQRPQTPLLVFANHSTVADAAGKSLRLHQVKHAVITGKTPPKKKAAYLDAFRDGVLDVLVGTASLATGTDGLDKVCDTLLILDDTDDDALRRQLIGRIMPRGAGGDPRKKQVYRLVRQ